ncbi:MAG: hypothetical protein AAFY71_17435 [Bacteroidota bacterium]
MNKNPILIAIATLLLGFFSGCSLLSGPPNIAPPDLNPVIALPLAKTQITIGDLLDNYDSKGFLEVDGDGLINFNFDTTLTLLSGSDFDGVSNFTSPVIDTLTTISATSALSQSLTQAILKGGSIAYTVVVNTPGDYQLELEMPELTQNAQTLKVLRTDSYQDTLKGEVLLNGYELNSPSDDIRLRFILRDATNNQLVIPAYAEISILGVQFSYLQASAMNFNFLPVANTVQANLFPNIDAEEIFFEDPSMTLDFTNGIGCPVVVNVAEFKAIGRDGDMVALGGDLAESPLELDYPRLSERGNTRATRYVFDKSNSNFQEFFNVFPNAYAYDLQTSLIYEKSSPTDEDIFIEDTSKLDLNLQFDLPLDLRIREFVFADTQNLNLNLSDFDDSPVEFEFKMITENAIPMVASMQIYFRDSQGQLTDSLFDSFEPVLAAGTVDDNGNVIEPAIREFFFSIRNERINNLERSTSYEIRTSFSTAHKPGETVKWRDTDSLTVKLGMKVFYTQ